MSWIQRLFRRWGVKALCATLLVSILAWGGWQLHFIHVRHRLETVTEGHFYRSGVIPPAEIGEVASHLRVRTVLDFRTTGEGQDSTNTTPMAEIQAEAEALRAVGIRHIHLPTPQVPAPETVTAFLEILEDSTNRPVLIHCYHGIGRTELFAALYRIEFEGWSPERARKATRFFLPGSSFSNESEKGRYLLAYQRQRQMHHLVREETIRPLSN